NAFSATHEVTAVTPVDLAPNSPTVNVTPPEYASSTLDGETLTGLVDLTALKHSRITFNFTFTRPAVSAVLEMIQGSKSDGAKPTLHELTFSPDRTTASLTLTALAPGGYRLRMEAEHGIRTDRDGGLLSVKEDLPPALLKFTP